jgi:hypothetical protein
MSTENIKSAFYQMEELLTSRDYEGAKSLMNSYCDMKDVNYGELKMILVITKSFREHEILKVPRKRVLDLIESKYGKQV